MFDMGTEISVAPVGGNAAVDRLWSAAREAGAVDSRPYSSSALGEVLNRQAMAMEPGGVYGLGVESRGENVSRIEDLMGCLERKYNLTEE